ncbi:hypothetical protein [uncultured Gammaproteobacteria bacterium]|nr:hypothetical protein [uncultured Gammaproteobacteria bacterium]
MILVKYCLVFIYLIIDIKIITKVMTINCGQCEDLTLHLIHIAPVNLMMMRFFNLLQCYVVSFASVCRQIHHTSSSKNAFSTIKSPIDVDNSSNTIRVFLNSDAIYDNYKCVPLDDLFICALYNNDNNTLLQIEDR